MGDHYIPQFYLRGFAEEPGLRSIYMFQKGVSTHVRTNIRNVAQQTKLYSREIESFFANSIETPAKPILDKIIAREQITESERRSFVTFLVSMLRRLPSHKGTVVKWFDENAEPYYSGLDGQIRGLLETNPDKREILYRRLEELDAMRREKRITPEAIWFELLASRSLPKVSWALENMSWQFLITDDDSFLTSDNPVFFFRNLGVGRMNSEVSFPICSKVALLATWQSKMRHGFLSAKERQIHEINRRTASCATQYVFSSRNRGWIPNLVNKSRIKLHPLTMDSSNAQIVSIT